MLLDRMPSRTRVKKEGKRMSFIFQFLIVSRVAAALAKQKEKLWQGSFGWFGKRKSKGRGSGDLLFYLVEIW